MPKPKPPYAQAFRDQMVELVRSGRKPRELSKEFGCHVTHKGGAMCPCLVPPWSTSPQPHGAACRTHAKRRSQFVRSCALPSWIFNLSRSRVSAASCLSSVRSGSIFWAALFGSRASQLTGCVLAPPCCQ